MSFMRASLCSPSAFGHLRLALAAAMLSLLAACQAPPAPQIQSVLNQFSLAEITVDYSRLNQPL
nr:hypothetical protein [Rhizobium sp.]